MSLLPRVRVVVALFLIPWLGCTNAADKDKGEKESEAEDSPTALTDLAPYSYPEPSPDPPRTVGQKRVLISGGRILTATGTAIANGYVVVEQGLIKAVGEGEGPMGDFQGEDALIISAAGKTVTPGFIDTHSHMGVYPNPGMHAHSDGNEATRNASPEVHAEHSFWPQDPSLWRALAGGITTIQVLPGSANLIGGKSFVAKLKPAVSARLMRFPGAPLGLKMACGENPKRVYKDKGGPSTRMGNVAGYKSQLQKAHEKLYAQKKYQAKLADWQNKKAQAGDDPKKIKEAGPPPDAPGLDHGVATLVELLEGKIQAHIHCYRADEMSIMLDLAEQYGFTIKSFHHGLEAYKIKERLAASKVTVSTWADWWGFKMEAFDGISQNIVLLEQAGALPLVHSDSEKDIRILGKEAAKAAAAGYSLGIPPDEATMLKWVTLNPAIAMGIDGQVGTLEAGKHADIVLWDGSPFSVYAKADVVLIDGEVVFDRSQQQVRLSDFELASNTFGLGDGSRVGGEKHPVPQDTAALIAPKEAYPTERKPISGHFVISGARIELGDGQVLAVGSVAVTDGKITAVQEGELNPGGEVTVIDGKGKTVTPGFVETWTQLGLYEVGAEDSTVDSYYEGSAITPALDAADAFHPHSHRIPLQRVHGITTVVASPTGGLIAGQGFRFDLTNNPMATPGVAMFGAANSQTKASFGGNRAGLWLRLRELVDDAEFYQANQSSINIGQSRPLSLGRLHLAALQKVLSGNQPLVMTAYKESDIRALIGWQQSLGEAGKNLRIILAGGNEAWLVAPELKQAGIPVIVNPTDQVPFSFDATKSRDDNAAILARAGVKVILSSHSWMNNLRRLRQEAGIAVSYGFPRNQALAAITSVPALAFGLDDVGELSPGKKANLVLWSGDPFEMLSVAERIFIDGREQDLTTRQKLLAKRYH